MVRKLVKAARDEKTPAVERRRLRRVRATIAAADARAVFELLDGTHEADVALLDQVEERQPSVHVSLGEGDDEAQVGAYEFGARR
jgi:hypothetical protein